MQGEREKKEFPGEAPGEHRQGHSLEALRDRLRDLCARDLAGAGYDRTRRAQDEAERACLAAGEHGLLIEAALTWSQLLKAAPDRQVGTEHLVEFEEHSGSVIKLTVPPKLGLIPRVLTHPVPNLRGEPGSRQAIEFVPATPLEYLERWIAANEVLGDDVSLTAVIRWADGQVSFAIRQPHYAGVPASEWEIEAGFCADGWASIRDPGGQHRLFYHHAWQVLAIDALPRNCYIRDGALQPFDVILCRPDPELERYLALYPDDG